jgi:hypothetical protein
LDYLQIIEEKDAHEYKLLKYLARNGNFQRQQRLIEDQRLFDQMQDDLSFYYPQDEE